MYKSLVVLKGGHSSEAFAQLIEVNLNLYAREGFYLIWSGMPDTRTFHALLVAPPPAVAEPVKEKGAENASDDQSSAPVSDSPEA